MHLRFFHWVLLLWLGGCLNLAAQTSPAPLLYQDEDLVVDLGVGLWAWPLPMDYDDDGDLDLVVVCPDKPFNGTYFFENRGRFQGKNSNHVVFEPPVKIDRAIGNPQLSRQQRAHCEA